MSTTTAAPWWIVSRMEDVAAFFDRSLLTLKDWRQKGMPGEKGRWDVREILRWKEANVGDANRNVSGDRGRAEAERQKVWAQAGREQLKLQEEVGQLIPLDQAIREYARHATHARALWEQTPDRLLGLLPASATGEEKRRYRAEAQKIVKDVMDTFHTTLLEQAEQVDDAGLEPRGVE